MLSLGSTGFTTVEEMEGSTTDPSDVNCFAQAWAVYAEVYTSTGLSSIAGDAADNAYESCRIMGGSPGSQEPVVIEG
jgi:hypothetical protein